MSVMPSRSHIPSRRASVVALLAGLVAVYAAPGAASASPDALIEFSVAPVAKGSALQPVKGRVRLAMGYRTEPGVRLAPADLGTEESVDTASYVAGLGGPSLMWNDNGAHGPGFSAGLALEDERDPAPFNDRAARSVQWPIAGWPHDIGASLHAEAHADELDTDLRALVEGWLGARTGNVTPAMLAKYLAARIMTHGGASLDPLLAREDGGVTGFLSTGVARFAHDRAGSEFDMLRAYAAALRIAGIPARLAIGAKTTGAPSLHAWVEFYLYDERSKDGRWVAVDLVSQRRLSTDAPPVADAWRHFGVTAGLVPTWFGVPAATDRPDVLAPWRLECDPPCVPVRIAVRVRTGNALPSVADAGN